MAKFNWKKHSKKRQVKNKTKIKVVVPSLYGDIELNSYLDLPVSYHNFNVRRLDFEETRIINDRRVIEVITGDIENIIDGMVITTRMDLYNCQNQITNFLHNAMARGVLGDFSVESAPYDYYEERGINISLRPRNSYTEYSLMVRTPSHI